VPLLFLSAVVVEEGRQEEVAVDEEWARGAVLLDNTLLFTVELMWVSVATLKKSTQASH